jgi:hypothetical protein
VPVWVPHIQTFKTETRAWIYRSPKWNNECLFNAENRICREYTSRLGAEISDLIINKARPQISSRYRWYGCGLNFPLVINYRGGGDRVNMKKPVCMYIFVQLKMLLLLKFKA